MQVGTKIKVRSIDGKIGRNGSKAGRIYTTTDAGGDGFYRAITDTGKKMVIWNVSGDWSKIGIYREGVRRVSYTYDFRILPV